MTPRSCGVWMIVSVHQEIINTLHFRRGPRSLQVTNDDAIFTKQPSLFASLALQACNNLSCIAECTWHVSPLHGWNPITCQVRVCPYVYWWLRDFVSKQRWTLSRVCAVLLLLHEAGVSLNINKCKFFNERIAYLKYIVRPGKFELPDDTTEANFRLKSPPHPMKLSFAPCMLHT